MIDEQASPETDEDGTRDLNGETAWDRFRRWLFDESVEDVGCGCG